MRRLLILVLLVASTAGYSQLRKGHRVFEPYYGFPNFGVLTGNLAKEGIQPIIEKHVPQLDKQVGVSINGLGPMGGRYEHMLSKRWSFSFAFVYNHTSVSFQVDSFRVEEVFIEDFEVNYTMRRYRGLFGFNFHFVNTRMWDCYFGLAGGFNARSHKIKTEKVNTNFGTIPGLSTGFSGAYPYAARTNIGFRFYPTNWMGLGMEFGLGGPLVSGGISFRFNPRRKKDIDFDYEDQRDIERASSGDRI